MGGSVAEGSFGLCIPTATQRSPTLPVGSMARYQSGPQSPATPVGLKVCKPTGPPPTPALVSDWYRGMLSGLSPDYAKGKGDSLGKGPLFSSVPGLLPVLTGSTGRKAGL